MLHATSVVLPGDERKSKRNCLRGTAIQNKENDHSQDK